jgi:hypothetical protein
MKAAASPVIAPAGRSVKEKGELVDMEMLKWIGHLTAYERELLAQDFERWSKKLRVLNTLDCRELSAEARN